MGLIKTPEEAATRQHTPKIAFVAKPKDYKASSGKPIKRQRGRPAGACAVDGQAAPRHDGHGAVAIGTAAAIPGTLVNLAAGGGERRRCASVIRPAPCAWAPKQAGQRRVDSNQGHHEPQRAHPDGRLGARAGRRVLALQLART
jgi:hypothetical protein